MTSPWIRTSIGKGLALQFSGRGTALSVAGVRADRAFRSRGSNGADPEHKLGLATGAWVAIGVGAAVGLGVLLFADYCHRKIAEICGDEE
jgi:hypothetical protein